MSIRQKDRDLIVQALRAGVVPRTGQQYIQVSRAREVEVMLKDIERIGQGGAIFRIVIGEYGAGKTFFLNLVRAIALQQKLVTAHADLNPDRRLQASGGQARSLFAELMKNLSTRAKPDGGALGGAGASGVIPIPDRAVGALELRRRMLERTASHSRPNVVNNKKVLLVVHCYGSRLRRKQQQWERPVRSHSVN